MISREEWLKFFEENKEEIIEDDLLKKPLQLRNLMLENLAKVEYNSGATKYCIIPKDSSFVFKWDRSGYDECEREYQNYLASKECGISVLFPKTEIFCTIGRNTLYIQEKVDFSADETPRKIYDKYRNMTKTVKYDLVSKVDDHCYGNTSIDGLWLKMLILLYGKKVTKKFENFTNKYKINDLHRANVGYINNRPVVLDFSGFGNRY